MTEGRKRELTQFLHEAMANLEIRLNSVNRHQLPPIINVDEYRLILQQYWIVRSINFLSPATLYEPDIVNASTKSKLLDFIRKEFASFIHEDQIQSASFFINGGLAPGYPLNYLLKQLLKIAIAFGVERTVSDVDRCTENTSGSFQYFALLEGIRVEEEIQVFEGMRIAPLPSSTSELPHYLPPNLLTPGRSVDFLGKTLLVINASISPIFCKPFLPEVFLENFQVEVTGGKFPNFKNGDFYEKFCQALSLTCNSAVQIALQWQFLAEHELFNLTSLAIGGISYRTDVNPVQGPTAGKAEIDETKCLYQNLVKLNPKVREKLQIPIDRWIKSKTNQNTVDKVIDLGIVLEALYLSDISETTELSFRLRVRASWYLGKDKENRKELMKDFSKIYEWRSKVVHTGKLPNKTRRTPYTPEEAEAFIAKAQDLCRDSIMKILEDGEFPDWNDLILGEDAL